MSLRAKIALLAGGVATVGLVLGLLLSYLLLSRLALGEVDRALHLQARALLEEARTAGGQIPPEEEADLLFGDFPAAAWIFVQGRLVWQGGVTSAPALLKGLSASRPVTVGDWRALALTGGDFKVIVAQPLGAVERLKVLYLRLAVPLVLLVGLISGGLAYLLLFPILNPLSRLAEAARRFEPIAPLPGQDEVARLAQAFAQLLSTLKEERTREQAFLALVSHELRTPIAAFRAGLEHLLGRKALDREPLERLKGQATRLEALAENLLAMSRAGALDIRPSRTDLERLLAEAYDRFQPLAVALGRELLLEAEPVEVVVDVRLLERAINNLVQNALSHGKGRVTLRSGREGEDPFVEVEDEGPGPPPGFRPGLGLRVVEQVAAALGAHLELQPGPPFRVRLRFRFPSAPSPTLGAGA
jgi:signal transduction histidine kinase